MNTFEQLIGKKIINILRLDIKEDYDFGFPITLFVQLDNASGLLVGQDFNHDTTTVSYTTLDAIRDDFGTEFNETFLNELKSIDQLTALLGKP
jgi:hypothetical protein